MIDENKLVQLLNEQFDLLPHISPANRERAEAAVRAAVAEGMYVVGDEWVEVSVMAGWAGMCRRELVELPR